MPRRARVSLSNALAAARMQDKPDPLPPGRLSPVSPLTCSRIPTPTSSSGSSGSAPRRPAVIYGSRANGSAGSSATPVATSTLANALPAGNICPSGRLAPAPPPRAARRDVLGSGTGSYGHGSVVRGQCRGVGVGVAAAAEVVVDASARRRATRSADAEEVRRAGNEQYKSGCFEEALRLYDRALAVCPDSVACRANRAAALIGLGRLSEAVGECEEALRLDPSYGRARRRLVSLHIRLGHFMDARRQISFAGLQLDLELHKLETVEKHLEKCLDARKISDWKNTLRECDAAIVAGADSCSLLFACRAEALLHVNQLDEADSAICSSSKLDFSSICALDTKFCGFLDSSYVYYVQAQVDMAMGRFDSALSSVEKARRIDSANVEVTVMLNIVRAVTQARSSGNELFHSGKFGEACLAYGEGLKHHVANPVLYCNRAACRFKLGQWEKCIEDCNEALKIRPNYTKALLRRVASYGKIERCADSVKDYEVLRKELPADSELAEVHLHTQVVLNSSQEVSNMNFGGKVETLVGMEQFQTAITLPGVSIIHFMTPLNQQSCAISPFVDALSTRHSSVNFLQVDITESPTVAQSENVRTVPTFKIYKNGTRLEEMICPSHQLLEYSFRQYEI